MNLEFRETYRDFSDDAIDRVIEYENELYSLVVEYPFDANPVKRLIVCTPKKGSNMCRIIIDENYGDTQAYISDMSMSTINVDKLDNMIEKLEIARQVVLEIKKLLEQGIPEP